MGVSPITALPLGGRRAIKHTTAAFPSLAFTAVGTDITGGLGSMTSVNVGTVIATGVPPKFVSLNSTVSSATSEMPSDAASILMQLSVLFILSVMISKRMGPRKSSTPK